MDYIAEANSTASNQFHGDLVSRAQLRYVLKNAVRVLEELDDVKKALFYGKMNPRMPDPHQILENCYTVPMKNLHDGAHAGIDTFHAIIGMATEAGELLEALLKAIENDQPVDSVNLLEETGDMFWYAAVLAKAQGFTFEEAQERNIAKLRKRYPEKFNEYDATVRNLDAERKELMGSSIDSVMQTTRRAILGNNATPFAEDEMFHPNDKD